MHVFFAQHGTAKSKDEDPERPLTAGGRRDAERVAKAAASLGIRVGMVHHSGKKRARETAEIFARYLGSTDTVAESPGLAPNDDPEAAATLVRQARQPIALVGHLPHLSRLSALLVAGDAAKEIIAFQNAALVCLNGNDNNWAVEWIMTPGTA